MDGHPCSSIESLACLVDEDAIDHLLHTEETHFPKVHDTKHTTKYKMRTRCASTPRTTPTFLGVNSLFSILKHERQQLLLNLDSKYSRRNSFSGFQNLILLSSSFSGIMMSRVRWRREYMRNVLQYSICKRRRKCCCSSCVSDLVSSCSPCLGCLHLKHRCVFDHELNRIYETEHTISSDEYHHNIIPKERML